MKLIHMYHKSQMNAHYQGRFYNHLNDICCNKLIRDIDNIDDTARVLCDEYFRDDIIELTNDIDRKFHGAFIKMRWINDKIRFTNEVRTLTLLKDTVFVPKIFDSKIPFQVDFYYNGELDNTWVFAIIVMEDCGISLLELYFPPSVRDEFSGPGTTAAANYSDLINDIEALFPLEYVPKHIIDTIIQIISILSSRYNIIHNDIHAGNFLMDKHGRIYVIDFE